MERCKQILVVFNCLFFAPAMVTLEVKNPFITSFQLRMSGTLEESCAWNSKCHLD